MNPVIETVIVRNPYEGNIPTQALHMLIQTSLEQAGDKIDGWVNRGIVDPDQRTFGGVILDPTYSPRDGVLLLKERVMAIVGIGADWRSLVPNAAGKCDTHDSFGMPNGEVLERYSHRLRPGSFAWPGSVEYFGVIGAGSGLTSAQDREIMHDILRGTVDEIKAVMNSIVERAHEARLRWLHPDDRGLSEYSAIADLQGVEY